MTTRTVTIAFVSSATITHWAPGATESSTLRVEYHQLISEITSDLLTDYSHVVHHFPDKTISCDTIALTAETFHTQRGFLVSVNRELEGGLKYIDTFTIVIPENINPRQHLEISNKEETPTNGLTPKDLFAPHTVEELISLIREGLLKAVSTTVNDPQQHSPYGGVLGLNQWASGGIGGNTSLHVILEGLRLCATPAETIQAAIQFFTAQGTEGNQWIVHVKQQGLRTLVLTFVADVH